MVGKKTLNYIWYVRKGKINFALEEISSDLLI